VIPWGHFCDGGRRTLAFSSPQPQTPALGQGHPLSPVRCPWAWRLSGVGQELGTRELVSGCPPHQKATVSDLTSRKQPDGPAQAAQQKTVCQPGCQRATTVAFYGIVWPGSAARKPRTQARNEDSTEADPSSWEVFISPQLTNRAVAAPGFVVPSRELSYKPKDCLPIPSHSWEYPFLYNTNQGTKGWLLSVRSPYVSARGGGRNLGSGVPRSWLALPILSCVTLHRFLRTSISLSV